MISILCLFPSPLISVYCRKNSIIFSPTISIRRENEVWNLIAIVIGNQWQSAINQAVLQRKNNSVLIRGSISVLVNTWSFLWRSYIGYGSEIKKASLQHLLKKMSRVTRKGMSGRKWRKLDEIQRQCMITLCEVKALTLSSVFILYSHIKFTRCNIEMHCKLLEFGFVHRLWVYVLKPGNSVWFNENTIQIDEKWSYLTEKFFYNISEWILPARQIKIKRFVPKIIIWCAIGRPRLDIQCSLFFGGYRSSYICPAYFYEIFIKGRLAGAMEVQKIAVS